MPELTGTKDLRAYLRTFWRWKWLFLFFVISAPLVAYAIDRSQPTVYKSSALVGINSTTVNSLATGSGSFSTSNLTAIAALVTTTPVADIAGGLLSPPGNPGQIASEVTASADSATGFLSVSAQDRSPARAAAIANAFARAISLNIQQSVISQINSSEKTIRTQLAHVNPSDTATKTQLQQQLDQLQLTRYGTGSGAAILQAATPSGTPVGGGTRRTVEIGLLIGVLLGFGAMAIAENADRRIRTPEDLERMTDLPLLAVIEPTAFSPSVSTTKEDDEAFQMLRTSLMYFNVERDLESVVVTSAGEKEGKTTVATRLAIAAATAGRNVILVDADLRRAQVGARLGITPQAGLGSVIVGSADVGDVLVDYPLDVPGAGELHILPAGTPPPNPSALMSSPRMQQVIRDLEAESDLVIVDTPAALAVSDPLPLMRGVTGVVIVARMNSSTRQTIRRLKKIVDSAHGNILGVVATGAASGLGNKHYYPTYYASNGSTNGSHGLARLRKRLTGEEPTPETPPTPRGRAWSSGSRSAAD